MCLYPVAALSSSPSHPVAPPEPNRSAAEEGKRRLRLVATLTLRPEGQTAELIARENGISRQYLYEMAQTAAKALIKTPPGPKAGAINTGQHHETLQQAGYLIQSLHEQVHQLKQQIGLMVAVDLRRRDQLELVCFKNNVSLRGTQEIISTAWGEEWRPGLGSLQRRQHERGRLAIDLLAQGRAQVADQLRCVIGDDIYFHQQGVKVVAEPESMSVLNLGRWEGSSGLDWVVWLEEYSNLALLGSDLCKDLVGAATQLGVAQSADLFHENRWFDRSLLTPLSRWEWKAREAYWQALDRATRPFGPGRRLSPEAVETAWREAERRADAFFVSVAVTDRIRDIYEPINPETGRLWTDGEVQTTLDEVLEQLSTIDHWSARKAERHVRSHGARFAAHRVMVNLIDVQLRPGSCWSRESVLNGLVRLWGLRRRLRDPASWVDWSVYQDHQRLERSLSSRLHRACSNLGSVAEALRRELSLPKRSSSGVESLNSKLRVMQQVHRKVSDEMLGLAALAWNLTPRAHAGRRQGYSPYELLGIDIGQGDRPWYDVVLDAQDAERAAA